MIKFESYEQQLKELEKLAELKYIRLAFSVCVGPNKGEMAQVSRGEYNGGNYRIFMSDDTACIYIVNQTIKVVKATTLANAREWEFLVEPRPNLKPAKTESKKV